MWKCCFQYACRFGKLSSGDRTGNGQFSFKSQRKAMQRMFKLLHKMALISHASKVMLKTLQARLQQYVNWELPDLQAGFRKGRGTRDPIANIPWIIEKTREFQKKTSISASLTTWKPLTVWVTINCGKFLEMEIPYLEMPPYLSPEKPVCRSRSSS